MARLNFYQREARDQRQLRAQQQLEMEQAPQTVTHAFTLMYPKPEAVINHGCRLLWVKNAPPRDHARGFIALHTSRARVDERYTKKMRERHGVEFPAPQHQGHLVGVCRIAGTMASPPDRRHLWWKWWPGTWEKSHRVLVLSDVQSLWRPKRHSGRPNFWKIEDGPRLSINYFELSGLRERLAFRANRTPYVNTDRGLVGLAPSEEEIPQGAPALSHTKSWTASRSTHPKNPDWVLLASEVLATTEGPVDIYGGSHHG